MKLLLIASLLALLSCSGEFNPGKGNNSLEVLSAKPDPSAGGLVVRVKNGLSQHKPDLSVEICALEKTGEKTDKKTQRSLCFDSVKTVKYDDQVIYFLSPALTRQLLEKIANGGEIAVLFNDSYSKSLIHWHCYENPSLRINKDTKSTQYFDITVTQINVASYSCLLGSLVLAQSLHNAHYGFRNLDNPFHTQPYLALTAQKSAYKQGFG